MAAVPIFRPGRRGWTAGGSADTAGGGVEVQVGRSPRRRRRLGLFFRSCEVAQLEGGRVESLSGRLEEAERAEAVLEEGRKDPTYAFKDPLKEPLRHPSGVFGGVQPSYVEPEIRDVGYREPRYLDLFDPGISVIRDPRLDKPRLTTRDKIQSQMKKSVAVLTPCRILMGGCAVVVLAVTVVIIVVTVAFWRSEEGGDPRIQPPYVITASSCGLLRGVIEGESFVFRGIPYARPPLQDRRLKPALYLEDLRDCWRGNYSANVTRPCWTYDDQGNVIEGSEDCLLLDIYTPKLGYENLLPVVVFVGGSSMGSDQARSWALKRASKIVSARQVVLVSPQIRRGMLGFTPHPLIGAATYPHSSGNQGVSDLWAALTWVQRNVEHFGGDPHKVTLLGHQAGAAITWPILSSHKFKGLVQGAWITGAAPLHPLPPWRHAPEALARPLNCTKLGCLFSSSARGAMQASPPEWRRSYGRPWLVSDGVYVQFIEGAPVVPLMIGAAAQGTAEYLLPFRNLLHNRTVLESVVREILHQVKKYNYESFPKVDSELIDVPPLVPFTQSEARAAVRRYAALADNPWLLLNTLISDATVSCPALRTAASLSRNRRDHRAHYSNALPSVFAYVAKHARVTRFGALADGLSDVAAILGVMKEETRSDSLFAKRMQDMFFLFVQERLPQRRDFTPAHLGVYLVDEDVQRTRSLPRCRHWEGQEGLARHL